MDMKIDSMLNRLFVYGTLTPGGSNFGLLRHLGGNWQQASLLGYLDSEGWGHCEGYPAIIPHLEGNLVPGWMLETENLAEFWQALDSFEGACYERVLVSITTESGEMQQAHTYILAGEELRDSILAALLPQGSPVTPK